MTTRHFLNRWILSAVTATACLSARPAAAYNEDTHQELVDLAYQVMRLVEFEDDGNSLTFPGTSIPAALAVPPSGVNAAEWQRLISDISAALPKLNAMTSGLPAVAGCALTTNGTIGQVDRAVAHNHFKSAGACELDVRWTPHGTDQTFPLFNQAQWLREQQGNGSYGTYGKFTGNTLGMFAANIDYATGDWRTQIRPTAVLGLGYAAALATDAVTLGLAVLLAPVACLIDLLGGDDCSVDGLLDVAEQFNPVPELLALIPGIPLERSLDHVGLGHFINVQGFPATGQDFAGRYFALTSNRYDDRQGLFYEQAGPDQEPGSVDLLIMAAADLGGISVLASDSAGTDNYQISSADDGHPRTNPIRSDAWWEFTTLGHVAFTPLDNLAYHGWRNFRSSRDPADLGRPLHALGDAVAPHHVIGSTSWGHRPYEDGVEQVYNTLRYRDDDRRDRQYEQARRILVEALRYRRLVLDWRASAAAAQAPANDVPVRHLITTLAADTLSYANSHDGAVPGLSFAFNDYASFLYTYPSKLTFGALDFEDASSDLSNFMAQPDNQRALIEKGAGAIAAFLISTADMLPPAPVLPPGPGVIAPSAGLVSVIDTNWGGELSGGVFHVTAYNIAVNVTLRRVPTGPEPSPLTVTWFARTPADDSSAPFLPIGTGEQITTAFGTGPAEASITYRMRAVATNSAGTSTTSELDLEVFHAELL